MATHIYGLVDPRDDTIHYVGQTRNSLRQRLLQHRSARRMMPWMRVCVWMQSLVDAGYEPEIVLLEEVSGEDANEVERRWITTLINDDHALANTKHTDHHPLVTIMRKQRQAQDSEEQLAAFLARPARPARPVPPRVIPPPAMTGNEIRAFRRTLGMSQAELAKAIGYHYSTVSLWESDKRTPPPSIQIILDHVAASHHDR